MNPLELVAYTAAVVVAAVAAIRARRIRVVRSDLANAAADLTNMLVQLDAGNLGPAATAAVIDEAIRRIDRAVIDLATWPLPD